MIQQNDISRYCGVLRELCATAGLPSTAYDEIVPFFEQMSDDDAQVFLRFFSLYPGDMSLFVACIHDMRLVMRGEARYDEIIEKYRVQLKKMSVSHE